MLYCPNQTCQTLNPETHKFCQTCRTPLPHRYLWAVGTAAETVSAGERVGDRYLHKGNRIFLDTRPGDAPLAPVGNLPIAIEAYLRLSPHRLHIPQVYDIARPSKDNALQGSQDALVLLDHAALSASLAGTVPADASAQPSPAVHLLPSLADVFSNASPLRQLNWLWQIAQLWHPLELERVVTSLLIPELLRVEGPILRLQELVSDTEEFSLVALGELWAEWVAIAHPAVQPFLRSLCQQLQTEQIHSPDLLIQQLDQEMARLSQRDARQLTYITLTDQGPSRQRNEDACYPPGFQVYQQTLGNQLGATNKVTPYVIVCDGIGGHQGGDVASQLAIQAVQRQLQTLQVEALDPPTLMNELSVAVCIANDLISQRNDSEQRLDRQRMGTTLVVALIRGHEIYLTHVGDSRAYWITAQNCHQITLDDDVASREVRLGYSFYREALQNANSGSLVQALGMNPSVMLHPTVQRFVLDEDSVFLLCSDGLSDNDRVEQFWDVEILPLLAGKTDVATVGQRLVAIANTLNGHDNVTVALLHSQVSVSHSPAAASMSPQMSGEQTQLQQTTLIAGTQIAGTQIAGTRISGTQTTETQRTAVVAPSNASLVEKKSASGRWLWLLAGMLLAAGGVWAFRSPTVRQWLEPVAQTSPTPLPSPTNPLFPRDTFLQVGRVPQDGTASPVVLFAEVPPPAASPVPVGRGILRFGSVLKVVGDQQVGGDRWLQLQVCSLETPATPSPIASPHNETDELADESNEFAASEQGSGSPTPFSTTAFTIGLRPGEQGWVKETDLVPLVRANPSPSPEEQGTCASTLPLPTPPPAPSPSPVGSLPPAG